MNPERALLIQTLQTVLEALEHGGTIKDVENDILRERLAEANKRIGELERELAVTK